MSDNGDKLNVDKQEIPKSVVMTIALNQEGQLNVQAPGNGQAYDIPMCLYLMDLAKDHVKAVNRRINQPRVIPASGLVGIKNRLKGAFGK